MRFGAALGGFILVVAQLLLAVSPGDTYGLKGRWLGWGVQSCRKSRVEIGFASPALPGSSAQLPPGLVWRWAVL